jgi:membrane-associated phospholipid phosphatase
MQSSFIPNSFPNKGIKIFVLLCILYWIASLVMITSIANDHVIFKWVNTSHCPFLDLVMPWITQMGEIGFVVLVGVLALLHPKNRTTKYFILTALLCNLIPTLINVSLKNIYLQHRPLYFFQHESWLHFIESQPKQYHLSFPSGHTVGIFALMTFLSLLLSNKYSYWALFFFVIGILTSYSRIYLVQHFFSDVFAGSLVGVVFCILTYVSIQNIQNRQYRNKRHTP